jgi:hypothetical protein
MGARGGDSTSILDSNLGRGGPACGRLQRCRLACKCSCQHMALLVQHMALLTSLLQLMVSCHDMIQLLTGIVCVLRACWASASAQLSCRRLHVDDFGEGSGWWMDTGVHESMHGLVVLAVRCLHHVFKLQCALLLGLPWAAERVLVCCMLWSPANRLWCKHKVMCT